MFNWTLAFSLVLAGLLGVAFAVSETKRRRLIAKNELFAEADRQFGELVNELFLGERNGAQALRILRSIEGLVGGREFSERWHWQLFKRLELYAEMLDKGQRAFVARQDPQFLGGALDLFQVAESIWFGEFARERKEGDWKASGEPWDPEFRSHLYEDAITVKLAEIQKCEQRAEELTRERVQRALAELETKATRFEVLLPDEFLRLKVRVANKGDTVSP